MPTAKEIVGYGFDAAVRKGKAAGKAAMMKRLSALGADEATRKAAMAMWASKIEPQDDAKFGQGNKTLTDVSGATYGSVVDGYRSGKVKGALGGGEYETSGGKNITLRATDAKRTDSMADLRKSDDRPAKPKGDGRNRMTESYASPKGSPGQGDVRSGDRSSTRTMSPDEWVKSMREKGEAASRKR